MVTKTPGCCLIWQGAGSREWVLSKPIGMAKSSCQSTFVRGADYAGADTVLVNFTPMDPPNPYFHTEPPGKAEEILPQLLS